VQGERDEELSERVFGAGSVHRMDFEKVTVV